MCIQITIQLNLRTRIVAFVQEQQHTPRCIAVQLGKLTSTTLSSDLQAIKTLV